jgi:DNA-binding NtrC family response regulator
LCEASRQAIRGLAKGSLELLLVYNSPENIRELQNRASRDHIGSRSLCIDEPLRAAVTRRNRRLSSGIVSDL